MKDAPRQQFRWAPHVSGSASVKPKDYEQRRAGGGAHRVRCLAHAARHRRSAGGGRSAGDRGWAVAGFQVRGLRAGPVGAAGSTASPPRSGSRPAGAGRAACSQLGDCMREPRLGDDIDDFCVRCKRIMNHSSVSVINSQPAKVRCRTCHSDHDFRHEQAPPPKWICANKRCSTRCLRTWTRRRWQSRPWHRAAGDPGGSQAESRKQGAQVRQARNAPRENCRIPHEDIGKCGAITTRRCKFSADAV